MLKNKKYKKPKIKINKIRLNFFKKKINYLDENYLLAARISPV